MSSEQPGGANISNQNDERARVGEGANANGADEFGDLPAGRLEEKQSEVPEGGNTEQSVRRRMAPNRENDGGSGERSTIAVPQSEAVVNQGSEISIAGRHHPVRVRGGY